MSQTPTQPSATPMTDAAFRKCVCHNLDLHVLAGDMAKMEVELAAAKAECERLKADVTRETTVCDTACMDAQRLRAEVEKATAKIANQAERIRYLEGATNHATGTPLSLATERAERAESALALYRSKVYRVKSILASIDDDGTEQHTSATAERAEAEVLAQAALLGRSAEREADLLGKLSRAEAALAAARKDSQRLDWMCGRFDSQRREWQFVCRTVPNPTGSYRDAIDAAMTNSNHKTT